MRTISTPTGTALRGALLGGMLLTGMAAPFAASAQRVLWADAKADLLPAASRQTTRSLDRYRVVGIQTANLRAALAPAPSQANTAARNSGTVISLPLPDGTSGRFRVVETQVMHPQLAAKFPSIKTYAGQGIDDPAARAYFDLSPAGLHVMIMSPSNTVFVDPTADGVNHLVFYKRDINQASLVRGVCGVDASASPVVQHLTPTQNTAQRTLAANGTQLRTYRLAMACTGEYAATKGGTVTGAMAGITASVNRVSGVYETELAIRFQLIGNNDQLVYLDPNTDPYTNISNSATLLTNQSVVDTRIGAANYDIGHVFNTDGGGIAGLGVACVAGNKARGTTGLPNPTGDAFDIDFVAHEIGHQFGGNHTFNGMTAASSNCTSGTRASNAAYEPGSGSTIMAYAGICGTDNLQRNSDPFFHTKSFDEIMAHVASRGNCAVITPTGNTPPTVDAGAHYFIPKSTPFELTGVGSDANNDPITYNWEQFDLGPGGSPNSPSGNAPIFRSFVPSTSPTRVFPRLSNLLANTTTIGEILPTYDRSLHFRLTVRDNRVGGGGMDYDTASVGVVAAAGPFLVTAPNTAVTWRGTVPQQVTWNVANTTAAPINAANVDILLSTDGGNTYPYTLLAGTPNDGSETVTVPATVPSTTQARIKVKASGGVFFDISNVNFTLQVPTTPGFYVSSNCAGSAPSFCPGSSATCSITTGQLLGFTGQITLSATGLPSGMTATFGTNPIAAGSTSNVTLTTTPATTSGTYQINIVGTSTSGTGSTITETQTISVIVRNAANVPPTLTSPAANSASALPQPTFEWTPINSASSYDLQVASDVNFTNLVIPTTSVTSNTYTATTVLTQGTRYYWRVRGIADCGVGNWSTAQAFTVGRQYCAPAITTNTAVNIASTGSAVALSQIVVSPGSDPNSELIAGDVISAVRVRNLRITHPNIGELIIALLGPTGRRITLASIPCSGSANMQASFDDAAATGITCPAVGTFQPLNQLENYRGTTPFGTWTLLVQDTTPGNGGDINGWGIEICTTRGVTAAATAQKLQGVSVFPNPSTGDFQLNVDNGLRGLLQVRVTDAVGRVVMTKELSKGAGLLQEHLDLSKLSRGMYQLHLELPGGGVAVEKLMKL